MDIEKIMNNNNRIVIDDEIYEKYINSSDNDTVWWKCIRSHTNQLGATHNNFGLLKHITNLTEFVIENKFTYKDGVRDLSLFNKHLGGLNG